MFIFLPNTFLLNIQKIDENLKFSKVAKSLPSPAFTVFPLLAQTVANVSGQSG